jgi:hypothetical protein
MLSKAWGGLFLKMNLGTKKKKNNFIDASTTVGISFYRPQRSSGSVPEYSFGRIPWNL